MWLTKDLFFSGHTASTFLVVLFGWSMGRLRWAFVAAHLVVVASLYFGHIHYTIDVVGGWGAAAFAFRVPAAAITPPFGIPDRSFFRN